MAQATAGTKEFGDKGFLRRLTLATAWGEGLDGFDLGVLSVVLVPLSRELGISPVWAGLIGASSLIGIFFGAPIGGFLTDRFGRKQLFLIDICLFVVLGILQAFVAEGWQLFVVRLLLGIAIGAEYSIGSSMLSEFVPAHGRGRRVSYMLVFWYGGYLASVVAAYGLILPPPVLALPSLGCINIHASLLPRWRGAAPIQRAILAGDASTGITIMRMDAGLDTGPMLLESSILIAPTDTTATLHDRLAQLGAAALLRALPGIADGSLVPRAQPQEGVTHETS